MKNLFKAVSLLLLAASSGAVMAMPISGNIGFLGVSTVTGTMVNFNSAQVAVVNGGFAADGVMSGDTVAFTGFDYAANPFTTVASLWSVGGFDFDLETITVGTPTAGCSLCLSGRGTLTHGNYSKTAYWTYSGNSVFSNLQVFSSAVPEPSSLALLGLGLVGFGMVAYRRRRTHA